MGRIVASQRGFEAKRLRIIAVTLGRRFGGLGKSQPVGAGWVVNRNEQAGLLPADQPKHKHDGCDDQDNEPKKR